MLTVKDILLISAIAYFAKSTPESISTVMGWLSLVLAYVIIIKDVIVEARK